MLLKSDSEYGKISLANNDNYIELPGVIQNITINGSVSVENSERGNDQNFNRRYNRRTIDISLLLLTEPNVLDIGLLNISKSTSEKTPYSLLKDIHKFFSLDRVYTINNEHIKSRGIDTVVFTSIVSSEDSSRDVISVTMSFSEYRDDYYEVEEI